MRKAFFVLVCLVSASILRAQEITSLFEARTALSRDFSSAASQYQSLELKQEALQTLRRSAPQRLTLALPYNGRQLELEMEKVKITSSDFKVTEARADGSRREVEVPVGVYYQGRIKGDTRSLAAISILDNQVMGIIADDNGNHVLGATLLKKPST